jgi:ATP/maltotriose-dependent transcriptional regulator MalT
LNQSGQVDKPSVKAFAQVLATQCRLDDLLGAEALVTLTRAQAHVATMLADQARGPHAHDLRLVAAEWIQSDGWLHASTGRFTTALPLLDDAEDAAQELGASTLVAQARNFRGYIYRQRGDAPGLVRHFLNAYTTVGAHPAQLVGDAIQAAHGHALLGERDQARMLLDEASVLAESAATMAPPRTAYWLTPTCHHLNLGLAHLGLGEKDVAADRLRTGLDGLPVDQRDADWTTEYRQALSEARRQGGEGKERAVKCGNCKNLVGVLCRCLPGWLSADPRVREAVQQQDLGTIIRLLRSRPQLSQEEPASITGLGQPTISRLESGRIRWSERGLGDACRPVHAVA